MSHGHIYGPKNLPPLAPGSVFLSGHTHIPTAEQENGIWLFNPGSLSLPKGGHPKTYGILNRDGFTVFTIHGDLYMQAKFNG